MATCSVPTGWECHLGVVEGAHGDPMWLIGLLGVALIVALGVVAAMWIDKKR